MHPTIDNSQIKDNVIDFSLDISFDYIRLTGLKYKLAFGFTETERGSYPHFWHFCGVGVVLYIYTFMQYSRVFFL